MKALYVLLVGIKFASASLKLPKWDPPTRALIPKEAPPRLDVKKAPYCEDHHLWEYVKTPSELLPLENTLDAIDSILENGSNDLFSYADCSNLGEQGERERSLLGVAFLLTNVPYLYVGSLIAPAQPVAGNLLNVAGVISFVYHYLQVSLGPNRIEVRRSLLVDYVTAVNACFIFGVEAIDLLANFQAPDGSLRAEHGLPFLTGALALTTLWRSALVDKNGVKYVFWHGLWHLLGAYTAWAVHFL